MALSIFMTKAVEVAECLSVTLWPIASSVLAEVGNGSESESRALQAALSAISHDSFDKLRVCYNQSLRRNGPHVSALDLISVLSGQTQTEAAAIWKRIKSHEDFDTSDGVHTVRLGKRRKKCEVVSLKNALQIIAMLPGRTSAGERVRASSLLTLSLSGDLAHVGKIYGESALRDYVHKHHPEHPLCSLKQPTSLEDIEVEEKKLQLQAIKLILQDKRDELERLQEARRLLSEELNSEHLLKKAKFETQVQTALAREEITQEQHDRIISRTDNRADPHRRLF